MLLVEHKLWRKGSSKNVFKNSKITASFEELRILKLTSRIRFGISVLTHILWQMKSRWPLYPNQLVKDLKAFKTFLQKYQNLLMKWQIMSLTKHRPSKSKKWVNAQVFQWRLCDWLRKWNDNASNLSFKSTRQLVKLTKKEKLNNFQLLLIRFDK